MDFLITRNNRLSTNHKCYVTNCKFKLQNKMINIPFVIDTGATRTVIPLHYLPNSIWDSVCSEPLGENMLYSITGYTFEYHKVNASDFHIAENLTIPKITVSITEAEITSAVLGFDILSLFTLRYDASINNGLWHIASDKDAAGTIEDIMKRSLNNSLDYIDPDFIAPISEVPFSAEDYLRERLGSKINYIAPVTRQECKTKEDCLELIHQVNTVLGL